METIGSKMLVDSVSRKLKILRPNIVMYSSGPNESAHSVLKMNKGNITIRHAFVRLNLKCSLINDTETSAMETVDVRAATRSRAKNSIDHS